METRLWFLKLWGLGMVARWIDVVREDCGSSFLIVLIGTVRQKAEWAADKELVEIWGKLEMWGSCPGEQERNGTGRTVLRLPGGITSYSRFKVINLKRDCQYMCMLFTCLTQQHSYSTEMSQNWNKHYVVDLTKMRREVKELWVDAKETL